MKGHVFIHSFCALSFSPSPLDTQSLHDVTVPSRHLSDMPGKGHRERLYFGILAASPPRPAAPSTQSVLTGAEKSLRVSLTLESGAPRVSSHLGPVLLRLISRQLHTTHATHVPRVTSMLRFPGSGVADANVEGVPASGAGNRLSFLEHTMLAAREGKCGSSVANVKW